MPPKSCSLSHPVPPMCPGECPNKTKHLSFCQCPSESKLSIHSGRILIGNSTTTPPVTPSHQRQQPSLAPAPLPQTLASVPQQPAYRAPSDRIFYMVHTCQPACLNRVRPSKADLHRGNNPLLTPLLYDFRRMTGRRKVNRKVEM